MQSVIEKGLAVVLVVMRCRLKEDAKCTHDSMSALIGNKAKQKCGVKKKSPEQTLYVSMCVLREKFTSLRYSTTLSLQRG